MAIVETAMMSQRGQVIIPKRIRDALGAKDSTLFAFTIDKDTVLMRKLDASQVFREIRARSIKVPTATIVDEIHALRAKNRDRH